VTFWEDTQLFDVPPCVPADPPAVPVELDPVAEARAAVTFTAGDGAALLRSDALRLPLADNTVDLVVTSPPYFALRSYQDGDGHYDGQIGSEPTPQAFLEALWAVTAECARVLKPSGSMFINLGDKYAGSGGHNNSGIAGGPSQLQGRSQRAVPVTKATRRSAPERYNQDSGGIPAKSLMLLPERYRIGCVDRLGLIARAVMIWSKPNGLPESVSDRVRRSHEDWVHLTKQPRYYAAVDNIREAQATVVTASGAVRYRRDGEATTDARRRSTDNRKAEQYASFDSGGEYKMNPLGKLPGSVWEVATEPLRVPDWVGVDHFAAFPTEWPRRLILGWSPSGVCTECGEGRRPVVEKDYSPTQVTNNPAKWDGDPRAHTMEGNQGKGRAIGVVGRARSETTITGEACACPTPDAPTRPAVVLDPFGGTGTTAMVARSLGRFGVSVDLSADYLRLARWRVWSSGHSQKAVGRTWRERQGGLFDGEDAA
jgi:DNA modification methylase